MTMAQVNHLSLSKKRKPDDEEEEDVASSNEDSDGDSSAYGSDSSREEEEEEEKEEVNPMFEEKKKKKRQPAKKKANLKDDIDLMKDQLMASTEQTWMVGDEFNIPQDEAFKFTGINVAPAGTYHVVTLPEGPYKGFKTVSPHTPKLQYKECSYLQYSTCLFLGSKPDEVEKTRKEFEAISHRSKEVDKQWRKLLHLFLLPDKVLFNKCGVYVGFEEAQLIERYSESNRMRGPAKQARWQLAHEHTNLKPGVGTFELIFPWPLYHKHMEFVTRNQTKEIRQTTEVKNRAEDDEVNRKAEDLRKRFESSPHRGQYLGSNNCALMRDLVRKRLAEMLKTANITTLESNINKLNFECFEEGLKKVRALGKNSEERLRVFMDWLDKENTNKTTQNYFRFLSWASVIFLGDCAIKVLDKYGELLPLLMIERVDADMELNKPPTSISIVSTNKSDPKISDFLTSSSSSS